VKAAMIISLKGWSSSRHASASTIWTYTVAEALSVVSNKRQPLCVASCWEQCCDDEVHAKIDNDRMTSFTDV
jgi:hypothetical protein